MRRSLRNLMNSLTAVSLLLCLATVALWVRSYWQFDSFYKLNCTLDSCVHMKSVNCDRGVIGINWLASNKSSSGIQKDWTYTSKGIPSYRVAPGATGFGYRVSNPELRLDRTTILNYAQTILFPLWAVTLVTMILPWIWAIRRLGRRRRDPGLCPKCGYDLRATPQAGGELVSRCPECGTATRHAKVE